MRYGVAFYEWQLNEANPDKMEVSVAQFDEMETFEVTRWKPISISLAVECWWDEQKAQYRTGQIIAAIAATLRYKGRNAPRAQEKYGDREDQSEGIQEHIDLFIALYNGYRLC